MRLKSLSMGCFWRIKHDRERLPVASGKQGSAVQEKKAARVFGDQRMHLSRMCEEDKVLLVFIAEKMAGWASGLKRKGPVDA